MGPYLTIPKKEKEVENGENHKVKSSHITLERSNLVLAACKDGGIQWRILILHHYHLMGMLTSLVFSMVMEVGE